MLIGALLVIAATYVSGHWLGGLGLAVLLLLWRLLPAREGPPILAFALTYHWSQVTAGIYYEGVTGEVLPAMLFSNWELMVLIGLGCVVCLAAGAWGGIRLVDRVQWAPVEAPPFAFSLRTLLITYAASILFTGVVQEVAWRFAGLTQMILALNYSHLALVFLLLRRFTKPVLQWQWVAGLLAFEVALGFTGYFAAFREPLILGAIAMFEVFNQRDVRHWAAVAVLALVLAGSSLLWMSVRTQYRADFDEELFEASRVDRLARVQSLSEGFFQFDPDAYRESSYLLTERFWAIYYPALALDRVPSPLPHTNGRIIGDALFHLVTPRILFPEKAELPSDSEMVRLYSGVLVAGAEQGTSIAFGYAGESYVDFGLPWMFIPVFIFGLIMGGAYEAWLRIIRHRELAVALVTVVFWLSLYQWERSWVKTLGMSVSLMVYLGGAVYLLDRFLVLRRAELLSSGVAPDSSFQQPYLR